MSGASEVPAIPEDVRKLARSGTAELEKRVWRRIIGATSITASPDDDRRLHEAIMSDIRLIMSETAAKIAARPVDTGREKALVEAAERVIDLLCADPAKDEAAAERVCAAFDARWKGGMMFERISDMGKALADEIRALANPENGRG